MLHRTGSSVGITVLAVVIGLSMALAIPGTGGAAAPPGCQSFSAQADAQDAFLAANGSPGRNAGGMDSDGDGVACEALPAPYKGYATIGYNRKKGFFYGMVTMPSAPGGAQAPCLYGNRSYLDAPRRLNIFKALRNGDKPLRNGFRGRAQADPALGRLVWKFRWKRAKSARYYVVFDERIRRSPYGRNECPGFKSRPTLLPRPRNR